MVRNFFLNTVFNCRNYLALLKVINVKLSNHHYGVNICQLKVKKVYYKMIS